MFFFFVHSTVAFEESRLFVGDFETVEFYHASVASFIFHRKPKFSLKIHYSKPWLELKQCEFQRAIIRYDGDGQSAGKTEKSVQSYAKMLFNAIVYSKIFVSL